MKLGCVVMAAGSSSRFGANKLLQDFRGKALYRWGLDAIPGALFSSVRVVTGYMPIAEAAEAAGFLPVENLQPELGVSHTIRLGLAELVECDGVLFMTADQPLLTGETIRRIVEAFQADPTAITAAACRGKRGNPCLFPQDLFSSLMALEGDVGGTRVIKANLDRLQLVETPEQELADCDTAQALRELEKTGN